MYKKTPDVPFVGFPKIARWRRGVVVTEKVDGTNAQVHVSDDGLHVSAGSSTRWIDPESDNYGFAAWVRENQEELLKLGPGSHFGEWYGAGIQRRYGLPEKRFALFNTGRWGDESLAARGESRPACCGVVPVLWKGNLHEMDLAGILTKLQVEGSVIVPGFMRPEGVVIFHSASGTSHKVLLEGDELPKGITTRLEREVAEQS